MAVNSLVGLAIATLTFYVLVAPIAIYIGIRHGVARAGPWYFMLLLTLIRIIGEPMTIASNGSLTNDGVAIAGYILGAIGLSPLLLMCGALFQTTNTALGEANSAVDPRILRLMGLVPLVSLIVGAIGSSNVFSSDPDTRAQGQSERIAATALYVAYWALLAFCAASLFYARRLLQEHRARVFYWAAVVSLPMLLVRLIDQCLITFGSTENQAINTKNIWIRAFMGSFMEFLVVIIYLVAGVLTAADAKVKPVVGSYEEARQDSQEYDAQKMGRVRGANNV